MAEFTPRQNCGNEERTLKRAEYIVSPTFVRNASLIYADDHSDVTFLRSPDGKIFQ